MNIPLRLCAFALGFALFGCSSESRSLFASADKNALSQGEQLSLELLKEELRSGDYGISIEDLSVSNVQSDARGMAHTRLRQSFEGVPVFGAEAIVHLNADGSLFALTSGLVKHIQLINPGPRALSRPAAYNTGLEQ